MSGGILGPGMRGIWRKSFAVLIDQGVSEQEKARFRKEIAEKYDWRRIAGETVRGYEGVQG